VIARGRNYAGCARLPPLGAGELGALPVGSAGWALAGGWEAPAGGRQGGRGDPGGGKGRLNFLYSNIAPAQLRFGENITPLALTLAENVLTFV